MSEGRLNFPFSAIVDQERLKLALLLNAVNPSIGGLLIRGPKGSGKSVGVRALGDLLPEVEVVADCPFSCSPTDPSNMCSSCRSRWEAEESLPRKKQKMRVLTLPLGATEDRVVGTLDIEKALREGVKALQPGILAEANQNILYVDEINLLPDHIVDDLLDAAASEWNVVEREAISVAHPSRFILVGTMNPEEGELRPQLLDRLPISVTLTTVMDIDERVEIVKRNLQFRRDPLAFAEKCSAEQEELREKILAGRELLGKTEVPDSIVYLASSMCTRLQVDGQRPDIIMAEVVRTIAAFDGRPKILPQDVLEAAKLTLNHRTRKGGFAGPPTGKEVEDAYYGSIDIYERIQARRETEGYPEATTSSLEISHGARKDAQRSTQAERSLKESKVRDSAKPRTASKKGGPRFRVSERPEAKKPMLERLLGLIGARWKPERLSGILGKAKPSEKDHAKWMRVLDKLSGLRREAESSMKELFRGVPLGKEFKIWIHTKFGLLPKVQVGGSRRRVLAGKRGISLTSLARGRTRFYEKPSRLKGDVALFPTIQASAASGRLSREASPLLSVQPEDIRTKVRAYRAAVTLVLVLDISKSMIRCLGILAKSLGILNREAYRQRDRLALIAFKEGSAHVLNYPTTNINVVAGNIRKLRASGTTPLADGMMKALEVIRAEKRRNRDTIPLVVIISDFLPNVPLKAPGHSDPQADTLYAAKMLKKSEVPVIAINTSLQWDPIWLVPLEDPSRRGAVLARKVAETTGGRYCIVVLDDAFFNEPAGVRKLSEALSESLNDVDLLARARETPIRTRGFYI